MKFSIAIYLCIVTSMMYAPCTKAQTDDFISERILQFILEFRTHMPCGLPDQGIPPLAPYTNPLGPLDIELGSFAILGNFTNLRIDDADQFDVHRVSFTLIFMRIDFSLSYPAVRVTGNFINAVGRAPNNCAIYGQGSFDTTLLNIGFDGRSTMGIATGVIVMGPMTSTTTLGGFISHINNFVGTQAESDACNRVLELQMPALFHNEQAIIQNLVNGFLGPLGGSFFNGLTLIELLGIITNPPQRNPCIV